MTLSNKQAERTSDYPTSRVWLASLLLPFVLAGCGGGGGGGGGGGAPVGVTPTPTPTPTPAPTPQVSVSLSASSNSVSSGDSVTITWSSENADSCVASGGWQGARATAGSESIGPLQSDQTFALSCSSGSSSGVTREVSVRLESNNAVAVDLSVDRQFVRANAQVTLSWDATDADRCEASGDWSGAQSLSGSFTTSPLTSTSDFTLTCFGDGQSSISSTSVRVSSMRLSWRAPDRNEDGTPLNDLDGYNIRWGEEFGIYPNQVRVDASDNEWSYAALSAGEYYVTMTALNSAGEESSSSNLIRLRVPE